MTEEQREQTELIRARLIKANKCKLALSAQFDADKHEPELEKELFLEMAKQARIEAECYEAFAASY